MYLWHSCVVVLEFTSESLVFLQADDWVGLLIGEESYSSILEWGTNVKKISEVVVFTHIVLCCGISSVKSFGLVNSRKVLLESCY